jgi:phage tail P2-like protein
MQRTIDIVPSSIRGDPQVIAACGAIDPELLEIYNELPSICFWPFINDQVPPLLDVLAWEMHVDVWQGWEGDLTIEKKRELINQSIDWHQHKGTKYAVEQMVRTVFAQGYVTEWFQYGGRPYFFKVVVTQQITDTEQLKLLTDSVNAVKNARSWMEAIEITSGKIPLQLWIVINVRVTVTTRIPVSTNPMPLKPAHPIVIPP